VTPFSDRVIRLIQEHDLGDRPGARWDGGDLRHRMRERAVDLLWQTGSDLAPHAAVRDPARSSRHPLAVAAGVFRHLLRL
jgi:hypothetical protein